MTTDRVYAHAERGHVTLGTSLRAVLFFVPVLIMGLVLGLTLWPTTEAGWTTAIVIEVVFAIIWGILVSGVRVAAQWERGVVLRIGKFLTLRGPGFMYIVPFVDKVIFVDLRLLTLNVPKFEFCRFQGVN